MVELRPKPELDPRRQALAEIGTKAFEALKTGYLDDLIALTPQDDNSALAEICPDTERLLRREVEARFDHCHQIIDWDAVDRADVFTGELVAEQATGCTAGISDYGRLQLYLHMNHGKIWQVDFLGAVGRDQQTLGINGQVVCRMVEDAPGPK